MEKTVLVPYDKYQRMLESIKLGQEGAGMRDEVGEKANPKPDASRPDEADNSPEGKTSLSYPQPPGRRSVTEKKKTADSSAKKRKVTRTKKKNINWISF